MARVVFLHPDLGIGGAEKAVIDAAMALKSRGYQVEFVTAHHDKSHCFQETKNGSLKVTAVGDWLPRSIFGKCYALCAYFRMIYAALYLVMFSGIQYDAVFCDQISACIPFLKIASAKVIFYCHFPDMLLTTRQSSLKRLYRIPLDFIEEKTTGCADLILVNSKFTANIFSGTFKSLENVQPEVLYPIPDFSAFDQPVEPPTEELMPKDMTHMFLSINRYERKKNLSLAVKAFGHLVSLQPEAAVHLVMAGGYDPRVRENVEHYEELTNLVTELGLTGKVTFLRSFSESQKRTLLKYSTCLLYTPENEHFGIVPIEAMYMKCPVIAMRSGGPLETVAHGETGYLCENDPMILANRMFEFVESHELAVSFGQAGKTRVETMFSFAQFTDKLDSLVKNLLGKNKAS